ncbi:MAG: NAD(P)/FAD-dependent oxidoreductase [Halioglobus sp.]
MFGLRLPQNTQDHAPSYYAATSNHPTPYPKLDQAIDAEIVIVGGGFTGVNTMLELSERGHKVVLLEANRLCWGASGRNGGQIIGGIGHSASQFKNTIGESGVQSIYDMGIECVDIIRERVEKYSIDCDIKWGYCDVAIKPRHMRWFEETRREERDSGYPHPLQLLDKDEVKEFVGSDSYIGGLYNPTGGGHLHSMNLCLGEARAAQDLGARIFELSEVLRITEGKKVTVHTAEGSVTADTLVLCGNGYMKDLVPKLAKRVLPASSCVVATESLSPDLAASVLPRDVAVCDPRTALDYFRLTEDRRMLFGGLSNYTGLVPTNYSEVMRRKMLKIFPQLEGVNIDYAWHGQMGIGLNRMPQLGNLAPNIYYIQAYSGHGVAPTHMMARITAQAICKEDDRFAMMSKIRHWPFPGGRYLRRPGMALGMLYFKAKDYL